MAFKTSDYLKDYLNNSNKKNQKSFDALLIETFGNYLLSSTCFKNKLKKLLVNQFLEEHLRFTFRIEMD